MRRLLFFVLPVLVACAPAAETTAGATSPMPATQTTTAAAAAGIPGNWTVTLSEADLDATIPQQVRSDLASTWTIAFHGTNHYVVTEDGTQVLEGPVQVNGNQITFSTGESGRRACNVPATYTGQISNNQITFTLVGQDTCRGRIAVLTSRPFTRQQ